LTAAHCFVDISKLKAYLGFNNISFIDDPSQGSEVIEVVKEIPVNIHSKQIEFIF